MAIKEFSPGDALQAIHLNQIVNAVNNGLPVTGGYGIEATSGSSGTTVALDRRTDHMFSPMVCKIKTAGPAAAADFTDYRYWCEVQYNVATTSTAKMNATLNIQPSPLDDGTVDDIEKGLPKGKLIVAYNINEYVEGTHSLPQDQLVLVVAARFDSPYVDGVQPNIRYVILVGGGALPTGQYQHQLYGMVSNNQSGWEFAQSHALI